MQPKGRRRRTRGEAVAITRPLGAGISGLCVVRTHILPRSVSGEATALEGRNARRSGPGRKSCKMIAGGRRTMNSVTN